MQDLFITVCEDLCELAGTAAARWDSEGDWTRMPIEVDRVKVMLAFNEKNPESLHLVGLLGAAAAGHELAVSRTMLAANFYLLGNGFSAFSAHPQTGEIMFQSSRPLRGCTAHDLHDSCKRLAALSRHLLSGAFGHSAAAVAHTVDLARLA